MSLIDEPEQAVQHALDLTAQRGAWGGPTYDYRGACIECMARGQACLLFLDGHPFDGWTFEATDTAMSLIDGWLDHGSMSVSLTDPLCVSANA